VISRQKCAGRIPGLPDLPDSVNFRALADWTRKDNVLDVAIAQEIPRLSEAEYLEIEKRSEIKSEFVSGEMFGMAGGT